MAENGNGSKYPTFQMLLAIAVSIILIIAGASLTETRSDIRDAKKATADVCDRVTRIEANYQFILDGIVKLEKGQEKLADVIDKHERSQAAVKKWQDYPESRK